jgi:hypothetical protein
LTQSFFLFFLINEKAASSALSSDSVSSRGIFLVLFCVVFSMVGHYLVWHLTNNNNNNKQQQQQSQKLHYLADLFHLRIIRPGPAFGDLHARPADGGADRSG